MQELQFDLNNYKENLRDSQQSLKKCKEEFRSLDEEFNQLQIEHVNFRKHTSAERDKAQKEIEALKDKLVTYKKYIDHAKGDKERLKNKIKEVES